MKNSVLKSFVALSFVTSSVLAQVEIDSNLLVNDNRKILRENKLNQKDGKKGALNSLKQNELPVVTNITEKNSKKVKGIDTSVYTKVKLIDAVLETLSQSEILKSARENVVQYELKVKNAMADYYPTVDFEYANGRTRSKPGADEDAKFKFFNDEHYKFVLRQNLYKGGSTAYTVKSIAKKLEVSKNQYKIKLDSEIKKATKAYFDVVFANRSVMVNERNMKKLNKILQIVTVKYDNGAASIGDLTSIKANVANAMTKLVKVKSKMIESLRYYEYIVGIKFEKTLPFEKNFDISIDEFDKLYERALENNKNLINYYKSLEAEKFKHKSARGKFEPKVDFELSYKETLQGEDLEEQEQDLNGKFKVTYNLFNGGRDKNRVLEINSTIRDLNFRLEEEKKKLRWNLSKVHTSLSTVSDALKSTIEEVVASRKMVAAYWEAFKSGEQDLQVLLQGQKQLNAAETEVVKFEKNQVNDFFAILELTGDLSAFFDVDPENPKFIDFSKSDYSKTIVAKDGQKVSLELEPKKKEIKKEEKKEEVKEIPLPKLSLEDKINKFIEEFNSFDDESFMIQIKSFNTIYDSFKFMTNKSIDDDSLSFDIVEGLKIKSIIVHNNFNTKESANDYIVLLKSEKGIEKDLSPVKVKDVKSLYKKYLAGLEIKKPKAKVKIVEKVRQEVQKKEFETNELFKKEFFNSSDDFFTINVSSFTSKKELERFILKNKIFENSFFFKYSNAVELYKLVYGIYPNYKNIEEDINKLILKNKDIFPVVEKIGNVKELFKENIDLNMKKETSKEYEYVSLKQIEKQNQEEKEKRETEQNLRNVILKKQNQENELKKQLQQEEEKAREEAQRLEYEKLEEQRIAEEKARFEAEKLEAQKLEQERERVEKELLEKEAKLAQERKLAQEKARLEAEKLELQKLEEQRLADEKAKLEEQKLEQERLAEIERQRVEKEVLEKEAKLAQERELAEEKARLEAQKLEQERLAEIERQRVEKEVLEKEAKLAQERKLAQEKARFETEKLEEQRLADEKAKLEAQKLEQERLAELERQRVEKELLEKEAKLAQEREIAEEKARLEAEKLELQKLEEQRLADEKAKLEAQKLEQERLAELERQRVEKELLEKEAKLAQERELAEEKARLEAEKLELQKLEEQRLADEKAKLEAQKLEQERLAEQERQRVEKELLEKEAKLAQERKLAEEKARLEAEKLEEQRIAKEKARLKAEKLELQKLEEQRLADEKAKLEEQKLEQERLAELERQRVEKELLEKEAKLAQEREVAEEKARLEVKKTTKKELVNRQDVIENNKPIEEIDLSNSKKEKREIIPYKKRIEIFEKEFDNANKDKYTLQIATINPEELAWYRKRFGLEPYHTTIKSGNKTKIYFGIFDTKVEAIKRSEYLHPLIYESNPLVKQIGNVR